MSLTCGSSTLLLKTFVRDLDPANVQKVKQELEIKGEVGALLQIICVVPPVMFPVITVTCFRAK